MLSVATSGGRGQWKTFTMVPDSMAVEWVGGLGGGSGVERDVDRRGGWGGGVENDLAISLNRTAVTLTSKPLWS